jgi:hypothetical protein
MATSPDLLFMAASLLFQGHLPLVTIDGDDLAVAQSRRRAAGGEHRWRVVLARDDRRVSQHASAVGDERPGAGEGDRPAAACSA